MKCTKYRPKISSSPRVANLVFGILVSFAFFIILNRSQIAIDYMKKGLKLCAEAVIPSLFPFMVISELLISSGMGERIGKILAAPMKRLFGVSGSGACAYLLGTLCGFPIGARTAVSMYDRGIITKNELTKLFTFCNNPGSAFVISAIGISLFGSKRVGVLLYCCVILSSVVVGIISNLISKNNVTDKAKKNMIPALEGNGIVCFTNAIKSSALSMLTVCAYVCFFSALVGCIGAILSHFDIGKTTIAAIFSFFELSSGARSASLIENKLCALILCAAASGWSGLSVHFQIISISSGRGVNFKYYFIAKAAQSVLCATFIAIAVKFLFPEIISDINNTAVFENQMIDHRNSAFICICFFVASVLPLLIYLPKKSSKKIKKGIDKAFYL